MSNGKKLQLADRLKGTEGNVWVEFGKLAAENQATNLGQGFPDFMPPMYVVEALQEAVSGKNVLLNQYTRSYGHPRLVNALAKTFSHLMDRKIDAMNEVLVTVGAYGSLFCAVQGLINPGDEAVIIEPFFDCYGPMVTVAGGTPKFVPLRPKIKPGDKVISSKDWILDPDELAAAFSDKTKLIILNTPNNPVGKMYSLEEMEMVANLCKKHDAVCIADEVYEWLVYSDSQPHRKIATLPDMWERTITIGSAGKTFSVTGWKIGWAIAPANLMKCLNTMHQNCCYTCPTPIQEAVAIGFEHELSIIDNKKDCYFYNLAAELEPKRKVLAKSLQEAGMIPTIPEGGYFMMADTSNMKVDCEDGTDAPKDFKFVRWLCKNKKLAAIPPSAFYSKDHKHLAANMVRFCFIKKDETLESASKIIHDWVATM
ncbi:kynurenine aminotransferase-like isoform X2 [Lineus longissimus]